MVPLRMQRLRSEGRLFALEVLLHHCVVLIDGGLDQLGAVLLDDVLHVRGHVFDDEVLGLARVVPDVRLAREQVDHAREVALGADRQDHHQRLGAEDLFDLLDDAIEVRAQAVELVHVDDARDLRVVGVTPVRLGLRLDAAGAAEHADAAIEHLERAVHLDGEVHVPRRIDDVEAVLFPEAGRGCRLDRDAALLLLDHEVCRCGTVVDLTDLVNLARELEDALSRGGFSRVYVRENTDVSLLGEVVCHDVALIRRTGCSGATGVALRLQEMGPFR